LLLIHLSPLPATTARDETRTVCTFNGEQAPAWALPSFSSRLPHRRPTQQRHDTTTTNHNNTANMYAPQFQPPPPGYSMPFDFHHRTTPPMSPGPGANYYSPRHGPQFASPSPRTSPKVQGHGHSRRASHAVPPQYSYASTRGAAYDSGIPTSRAYATPRGTPGATPEYVSGFDYNYNYVRPSRASRHRRDSDASPLKRSHRERRRHPSQSAPYVHTRVRREWLRVRMRLRVRQYV
jgi:hypothetical protein